MSQNAALAQGAELAARSSTNWPERLETQYPPKIPNLDLTPAKGDPGDETGRRFQFQYTYAACMACACLDPIAKVTEVFCEHHEDVLIKRPSGRYIGIQVKTRDGGEPFKASDEEMLAALT